MERVELLETKAPNKALYYIAALVVLVVSTLAAVIYVSTRPGNSGENNDVILAGIFTFVGPTIAGIMALLVALNVSDSQQEIKRKVNGTLTALAEKNVQLADQVITAQGATNTAQGATNVAQAETAARTPYSAPGGQ